MKGRGSLTLTGQLGDVMKESAQAALSYARSHAKEFGISERFLRQARHPCSRPRRSDSEGRPICRRDNGDGNPLAADG